MDDIISKFDLLFNKNPEEVIQAVKDMGIEVTWDWQQSLKAVKRKAFTVAKVYQADLVQEIKNSLEKSLEDGTSFNDFKKDIAPLMIRRGLATKPDGKSWRWDTIYRTNVQSAYLNAKKERLIEVKDTFEYWEFDAINDNRTRDSHRALDGIVLKVDDPFWLTNYPPLSWNCRCNVNALRKVDMERRNLKLASPDELSKLELDDSFKSNEEYTPDYSKYDPAIADLLRGEF